MAFYGDFGNRKNKEQRRKSAETRGGFEDEGSRYSGAPRSEKPIRSAKPGSGQGMAATRGKAAPERGTQGTQGTRPGRPDSAGKKGTPRKEENGLRFARDASQRYNERGAGVRPRPYGEQREARQRDGFAPRPAPFAPRSAPIAPRPVGSRGEPYSARPYQSEAPATYDAVMGAEGMDATDVVRAENLLSGRNPIREALKSGRDIEKLLVARGELSGSAREIVQMAKEKRIPVQEVDRARLDAITHNHQGMLAFASAHEYHTVQDMLDLAVGRGEAPLLVILDGITDPHNLGAVIRTAECAGAHGVIVQERRAVGLTPAAVKASAGAVEYLPVARVTNLTTTLLELKAQNIWAYAADMKGEDYAKVDFSGGVALVIGAEGEGVSRRVLDTCDRRVSLPIRGQISSLNASVAAGILLYAALRAR